MGLGAAPAVPVMDGTLATGTYRGRCETPVVQSRRRWVIDRLRKRRHTQTLQRFWGVDRSLVFCGCVIDGPVGGSARLWLYDRTDETVLLDRATVFPPFVCRVPTDALADPMAVGRFLDSRVTLELRGQTARFDGRMDDTRLTVGFDTSDSVPVTTIRGSTTADRIDWYRVVEHRPAVPLTGWFDIDGAHFRFDDAALGCLEHAYGVLDQSRPFESTGALGQTAVGPTGVVWTDRGPVCWIDGEPSLSGSELAYTHDHETDESTARGPLSLGYQSELGSWQGAIGDSTVTGAELVGLTDRLECRWTGITRWL